MAAVFSFGSFGDIISVVGLLNDMRQIVSNGRGSYVEYAGLTTDLDAFIESLQVLGRLQVMHMSEDSADANRDAHHVPTLQTALNCVQYMNSHSVLPTANRDTLVSALQTTIDRIYTYHSAVPAADTSAVIPPLYPLERAQEPQSADSHTLTSVPQITQEIRKAVAEVEKIAKEFNASLERYNAQTFADSEGRLVRLKPVLCKIWWALSPIRKKVNSMRNRLLFHGAIIDRLLQSVLLEA